MNIFDLLRGRKQELLPHNFSQLIAGKEKLIIFFPEDVLESYLILSYIVSWIELYEKIIVYVPTYTYSFFRKFKLSGNIDYKEFSDEELPVEAASILNFCKDKAVDKFLRNCENSTIVGDDKIANLQFVPAPKSVVEILEKFSGFSNLPLAKQQISYDLTKTEHFNNQQKYFHNRFPDFVLDIDTDISTKQLDKLIASLKISFSANIYLTHKALKNTNYPNLESIELDNFLQLFNYAISCNLFLTTSKSLAGLLDIMQYKCIYLGAGIETSFVKSVKIKDVTALQETVPKLMKKLA